MAKDYRTYPSADKDGEPKPNHVYDYPDKKVSVEDVTNTLGLMVIDTKSPVCDRLAAAKLFLAYACSLKASQLIDV
jgi:hypothetical protein